LIILLESSASVDNVNLFVNEASLILINELSSVVTVDLSNEAFNNTLTPLFQSCISSIEIKKLPDNLNLNLKLNLSQNLSLNLNQNLSQNLNQSLSLSLSLIILNLLELDIPLLNKLELERFNCGVWDKIY
jgi:hypothetical protein